MLSLATGIIGKTPFKMTALHLKQKYGNKEAFRAFEVALEKKNPPSQKFLNFKPGTALAKPFI